MKTKDHFNKYISSIPKMAVLSVIIIIIVSAFTFSSMLAEKGKFSGCDITISTHYGSATDSFFVTNVGFKIAGGW